jgi:hypothetical protein
MNSLQLLNCDSGFLKMLVFCGKMKNFGDHANGSTTTVESISG